MVNLVYTELLKLKRSMMFLMSLVGATATPLLCFIGFMGMRAREPWTVLEFQKLFGETDFGIVFLTGVPLFSVITTYLFNREYAERTLDNLLTIPVSRVRFVASKLILLFIWIMGISFVSWGTTVILGLIGQFAGLNTAILLQSLREFVVSGGLLFALSTPIVLVAILFKNYIPTVVFATVVTMANVMVANSEYRALFPWSAVLNVASNTYRPEYPPYYSMISIAITSLVGAVLTLIYFVKTDIN